MALRITRQEDAASQLCPAGWEWQEGRAPVLVANNGNGDIWLDDHPSRARKVWTWGYLILRRTPTLAARQAAYKALCDVLTSYEVEMKVQKWSTSSPTANIP